MDEVCGDGLDNNCNGLFDEEELGDTCTTDGETGGVTDGSETDGGVGRRKQYVR